MERTPRAYALLAPVDDVLARAAVSRGRAVSVDVGEVDGFYRLDGDVVVLSHHLEGPALAHPDEPPLPQGLDRWRRAAASVLEARVLAALPDAGPTWLRQGLAIHLVDRAVPELRLAAPDLLSAGAGDLTAAPRAGLAVLRAWEASGVDPVARADAILDGAPVEARELVTAARWLLGEGLAAVVPDIVRAPPRDIPTMLGPWSFTRLEVPAHPRGGRVRVRGRGGVAPAWAPADQVFHGVAAAAGAGCALEPEPGGPVGAWELRSAEGFGAVFGARGVRFDFRAGGRLEVLLADAFVGSLRDLAAAERVGTSGTATGRWAVAGPWALAFADVVPAGVAVHGRDDAPFVLPAEGFGLGEQLRGLEQGTWRWRRDEGGALHLAGVMHGAPVSLRLEPTTG